MKLLIAWTLTCTAAIASAGEQRIRRAEVPRPALAALERYFPGAKQLGFARETEPGKVIYEATLLDGARHLDVDLSADGKLLAVEETIALEAAPEAVKKALAASKYGKLSVAKAEKVTEYEGGKVASVAFELLLGSGGSRVELVLSESGKILKAEGKAASDD